MSFSLDDPTLIFIARSLDDIEKARKTTANRIGALTRTEPDEDGMTRGFGLDPSNSVVRTHQALLDHLEADEKLFVRDLERAMRNHPLGPWVLAQKGVGLKTAARVLGIIGDPYINSATGEPRTVAQLWSYTGYSPDQTVSAVDRVDSFSHPARMRVWNVVQPIVKNLAAPCRDAREDGTLPEGGHLPEPSCSCSPWRVLWDEARYEKYGDRVHTRPCKQCTAAGVKGEAAIGAPWKDAHAKAAADRFVAKRFLRELWREAARLHAEAAAPEAEKAAA